MIFLSAYEVFKSFRKDIRAVLNSKNINHKYKDLTVTILDKILIDVNCVLDQSKIKVPYEWRR